MYYGIWGRGSLSGALDSRRLRRRIAHVFAGNSAEMRHHALRTHLRLAAMLGVDVLARSTGQGSSKM